MSASTRNLGFDPAKDFAPLTLVTLNPQVIVAAPQYAGLDFAGLVARLKDNGGASFGSSGIGSATHIAGELYNKVTGSSLVHVPYRGQGPALNDLIAGRIDAMFPLIADTFGFLQSGRLKAAVVMSTERAKSLPNVPTTVGARLSEAGPEPDLDRALHQSRNAAAGGRPTQPRTGRDHRGAGLRQPVRSGGL